jgi:N-acetylglucosamine-6-sulfatase
MQYMPKVRQLITEQGTTFKGWVSDATCCPSRAAILSGRYPKNAGVQSNDVGCSDVFWQSTVEPTTMAVHLHDAGYHTGLIGKYQNQYGLRNAGLLSWVPPGWDMFYGQQGAGFFYNYNMSNNGVIETHGNNYANDYSTDVFARKALDFLDDHVATRPNDPFFLYTALIAPHQPEVAPQYANALPGITPPRFLDIYNLPDQDMHWFVRNAGVYGPYGANGQALADYQYRRRVLSLLSADDAIEAIINKVAAIGELDNTYIFYVSDNGYHFLDYGLLQGNFMPYERDVRVPFLMRGPGIPAGFTLNSPFVMNVDIAPTILDIANIAIPSYMDGQTILPFLDPAHLAIGPHPGGDFLIQHLGQVAPVRQNVPCALPNLTCGRLGGATTAPFFTGTPECACLDGFNNTYSCLRIVTTAVDMKYCEFTDNDVPAQREMYNIAVDPNESNNIYLSTLSSDPAQIATLSARLAVLKACTGASCQTRPYLPLPCASSPCQNGATCTDMPVYTYQCTCPAGYTGTNCEIDINECDSNPCVHGTCSTPNVASYQCTCDAGWTGTNCNQDIDECSSNPCVHGTCSTPNIASYQCTCNAGWTGTNCDQDIDECSSNPCVHGTCSTPNIASYQCTCNAGWTGANCNQDIDECSSNPCVNGGVCSTPIFNAYHCSCPGGYTGVNCQIDINECASSPCLNGGTCSTPLPNMFFCECPPGRSGPTCAEHGNDKDKGNGDDDDDEGDKDKGHFRL